MENEEEEEEEEIILDTDEEEEEDDDDEGTSEDETQSGSSSDEEFDRNATGQVPIKWYDEEDHVGYDRGGNKVEKSKEARMSEIERYLASKDDPNFRRTVYDVRNDESTVLTDRELIMVRRLLASKFPEPEFNAEPDYDDYFSSQKMVMPLSSIEPKRRFQPSKWERMKVEKIVRAIQEGHIRIKQGLQQPPKPKKEKVYLMWGEDGELEDDDPRDSEDDDWLPDFLKKKKKPLANLPSHIPAPKTKPPGHAESYHPPQEYLYTEEERKEWEASDPEDRKLNFIPKDYGILRRVPAYQHYVQERFDRCLDLFMCPRTEKRRLNIDPESLIPKLPSPKDLKPFPSVEGVAYIGHVGRVRCMAVDPRGQYLATGGEDGTVRLWEIDTGRCLKIWRVGLKVKDPTFVLQNKTHMDDLDLSNVFIDDGQHPSVVKLAWNPKYHSILAAAYGNNVHLLYVGLQGTPSAHEQAEEAVRLLSGAEVEENSAQATKTEGKEEEEEKTQDDDDDETNATKNTKGTFVDYIEEGEVRSSANLLEGGTGRTKLVFRDKHANSVVDMCWHSKGEYLATVSATTKVRSGQVSIHHIAKRKSQNPFAGAQNVKGDVQKVLFHPSKPIFFVATKTHVSVYHLTRQALLKKLSTGVKWISAMTLHPSSGDHVVVGSYDRRVVWHDLDLSSKPYKTLKYHERAVRDVAFHPHYPLLASVGDDGFLHIIHSRVYDDLMQSPMLIPVKRIQAHVIQTDGLGVLGCIFHPKQPWVFTCGADSIVRLFINL